MRSSRPSIPCTDKDKFAGAVEAARRLQRKFRFRDAANAWLAAAALSEDEEYPEVSTHCFERGLDCIRLAETNEDEQRSMAPFVMGGI